MAVPAATTAASSDRTAPAPLSWRLIAFVLLPFAGGFYLSYLYRSVNALIADYLASEFGIDAAQLGLLTSVYLLVTAVAQIPLGIMLDRYGPRRVQAALLVVAAIGALQFATARGFWGLLIGRALIGLGVATALMAGIKAAVMWVPKERLALANGILLGLGTLGAVTATVPAEIVVDSSGWRSLFVGLAVATLASAASLWLLVPESSSTHRLHRAGTSNGLSAVARNRQFWHLAPLAGLVIGTSWALQGLWAARWLVDVDGLARGAVVSHLLAMALALSAGAFGLGWAADRLTRNGITLEMMFAAVGAATILAQLALVAEIPLPALLSWCIIAIAGSATVLTYAILATYVPRELAARANALLNLFHFGTAFVVQWAFGIGLAQFSTQDGRSPAEAYTGSLAIAVVLQSVALLWFVAGQCTRRVPVLAASAARPVDTPVVDYAAARAAWCSHLGDAKQQLRSWRLAGIGSAAVAMSLAVSVLATLLDRRATVHVIAVDHVAVISVPMPMGLAAAPDIPRARSPPRSQIARNPPTVISPDPIPRPGVIDAQENSRPDRRPEPRQRHARRPAERG